MSVALFILTCIQMQGTILFFGVRERGFFLSIFGIVPLVPSIMGIVWWYSVDKRLKKSEKYRFTKDRTLLIINIVCLIA